MPVWVFIWKFLKRGFCRNVMACYVSITHLNATENDMVMAKRFVQDTVYFAARY